MTEAASSTFGGTEAAVVVVVAVLLPPRAEPDTRGDDRAEHHHDAHDHAQPAVALLALLLGADGGRPLRCGSAHDSASTSVSSGVDARGTTHCPTRTASAVATPGRTESARSPMSRAISHGYLPVASGSVPPPPKQPQSIAMPRLHTEMIPATNTSGAAPRRRRGRMSRPITRQAPSDDLAIGSVVRPCRRGRSAAAGRRARRSRWPPDGEASANRRTATPRRPPGGGAHRASAASGLLNDQ